MRNFKFNAKLISIIIAGIILVGGCSNKSTSTIDNSKSNEDYSLDSAISDEKTIIPNSSDEVIDNSKDTTQKNTSSSTTSNDNSLENNSSSTTSKNNSLENNKEQSTTIPNKEIQNPVVEDTNISSTSNSYVEETNENDNIVLQEFRNLKADVKKITESDTVTNFKEDCKNVFITIVDFIFYDGEIKGITFDELSDAAKQELLKEASEIDSLIVKKFPNYKEEISSFATSAYNKASNLIKTGANNIKDFAKDKLGEDNYNKIKQVKDDLKQSASTVWEDLKDDVGNVYDKAKEKIKNWYENFKN